MTTTTRSTHELQALRISTNGTIESVTIDTTETVTGLQTLIGCDYFDVVSLDHDIDLFVDDMGLLNGSPSTWSSRSSPTPSASPSRSSATQSP